MQPHIGGDLALLTGIAKRIDEMGAIDEAFLAEHCDGWPELARQLAATRVGRDLRASRASARTRSTQIAERYAAAKNVVFSWTMGITHHVHGVQNVQAIANLALMRGMVGRPQRGPDADPRALERARHRLGGRHAEAARTRCFERLQKHFGVKLPTDAGARHAGLHRSGRTRAS